MRKLKGFTLIELMIVIAIIAIIAAIAIPNLLQARIRANETNATSQIRNYAAAQNIFRERGFGALAANRGGGGAALTTGYAIEYPNLYYGDILQGNASGKAVGTGDPARLISVAHADAGLIPGLRPASKAAPFNGYFFREPGDAGEGYFDNAYAQIAYPENSTRTGGKALFFDDNGTVYSFLLPQDQVGDEATVADQATPLSDDTGWDY